MTLATFSSFKRLSSPLNHISDDVDNDMIKQKIFDTWSDLVTATIDFHGDFLLRCEGVEVHSSAIILKWKDVSGGNVQELRQDLEYAIQHSSKLKDLEKEMGLEEGDLRKAVHIPDIIHTTVARFKNIPHDTEGFTQRLVEWLQDEKDNLRSLVLPISSLHLLHEHVPYLHIPPQTESFSKFIPFSFCYSYCYSNYDSNYACYVYRSFILPPSERVKNVRFIFPILITLGVIALSGLVGSFLYLGILHYNGF